jgi:hypothetical protein
MTNGQINWEKKAAELLGLNPFHSPAQIEKNKHSLWSPGL